MTFCKQILDQEPQLFNQQAQGKSGEHLDSSVKKSGVLYLVSTPIGHLKDLTFRALETLQNADIIVCEDTRVTRKLLSAYEISPPHLWTYHEHNGEQQRPKILDALSQGKVIALVSDAGTPLISDPGFKLVKAAQDHGIQVTAAPGVSAVTTSLSLSGLATNEFYLGGFIPRKSSLHNGTLGANLQTNPTLST